MVMIDAMHSHSLLTSTVRVVLALMTVVPSGNASERADLLRVALKDADRVEVRDVEPRLQQDLHAPFQFTDAVKIAELVSKLEFDDASGLGCCCRGDAIITFFKGKEEVASLGHYHGKSLGWGGWKGQSIFTPDAAKVWREWFHAQGEPRFEHKYQEELAESLREQEASARFMKNFPPEAGSIFATAYQDEARKHLPEYDPEAEDKGLSPSAKKLIDLYPDGTSLGKALAKALGSLAVGGAPEGSWTTRTAREELVLECAKTLKAEDLQNVFESQDEEVLAGAARLFFFEKLAAIVPVDQRNRYAAKLCGAVLRQDKCENTDLAVIEIGKFPCPETIALLEQLAGGNIITQERSKLSMLNSEPSPRCAACVLLGEFGSGRTGDLAKVAGRAENLTESDQAALKIARSFAGERGLLDENAFESGSYTIGCGAIAAFEKEGGRAAIDAIIAGGIRHSWMEVRKEAVLTAERMIGWKPSPDLTSEQVETRGQEIREWWRKNREAYQPTTTNAGGESKRKR